MTELIAVLERTGTLEDFKSGCGEGVLVLVDWAKKRLREDIVPGETFADFQKRVREQQVEEQQAELRGES